jgi:hypothetical protein
VILSRAATSSGRDAVAVGVGGVGGLDRVVHRGVGGQVVAHHRDEVGEELHDREAAGREGADAVRRQEVVDRLVEGGPLVDAVAVAAGQLAGQLGHLGDDLVAARRAEAAQVGVAGRARGRVLRAQRIARVGDPDRVGEVVHRDHRADALGAQLVEHLAVVGERGLVPDVAGRLDARPLDAEAVAVEVLIGGELDVGDRAGVAADRVADELAALAEAAVGDRPGPQVPVGQRVGVLDLGGGAGGAEPEAGAAGLAGERTDGAVGDRIGRRRRAVVAAGAQEGEDGGEAGAHRGHRLA